MPSNYADALFRTGENLRRGLSDFGRDRRADAELSLMQARGQYDINRQQAQDKRQEALDALQRPALEMAALRARTQQDAYNQPVNIKSMFGPLSLHAAETGADEEIVNYLGATRDEQGNLFNRDGKPITQGWLHDSGRMAGVSDIVMSRLDLDTSMQDMIDHYQSAVQSGQIGGQEAEAAKREIGFMQNMLKNPDQRGQLLAIKRSALARLGDAEGVAKVDAMIADNIKSSRELAKERRGYAHQEKLEGIRQAGADRRMKPDKPAKGFESGEWLTPSGERLSTDDAFDRYKKSVPSKFNNETMTNEPLVPFESWTIKQGYVFNPSGVSPKNAASKASSPPSGRAGEIGKGYISRRKVNRGESPQPQIPQEEGARIAPDGNWYVPDPNRPGKYLQVVE